jgi:acyl-CoA synthetase (NDP forming)
MGMAVNPAMSVEKPLVAHKDGCGQVAYHAAQMQIGPLAEFGLIDDGLSRCDNLTDSHNVSKNLCKP